MRALSVLALIAGCGRFDFDPVGGGGPGDPGDPSSVASSELAAGYKFACAVRDGAIWCWGDDHDAQLADTTTTPRAVPGLVPGISDAKAVAAGGAHACALHSGGSVSCWGHDAQGQVGVASDGDVGAPVPVAGLGGEVTALALGGHHSCARLADATAWCWGANDQGQLAAPAVDTPTPTPRRVLDDVAAIAAGDAHTCALRGDGSVWCWGRNAEGELGDGTTIGRAAPMAVPGLTASAVIARGNSTCALAAGHYRCWGDDHDSQLGDGMFTARSSPVAASMIDTLPGVTLVGLGFAHACAVHGGDVACWGDGDMGEVGDPTRSPSPAPREMLTGGHAIAVVGGDDFSCALLDDRGVKCWGLGSSGQLGDGTIASWTPQKVGLPAAATALAAGANHTCASTGTNVYCWGDDTSGQLGDGAEVPSATPVALGVRNAAQLGLGVKHSCATINDGSGNGGTVECWGDGTTGALGNGTFAEASGPVAVSGLSTVLAVTSGNGFSCALTTLGLTSCWGDDSEGELGDGPQGKRQNTPQMVLSAALTLPSTQLTAGESHVCVAANGASSSAQCWGQGVRGQLGNGAGVDSLPVSVSGAGTGVTQWRPSQIAAGGFHTCAVDVTGELRCWGDNDDGAVGDTTTVQRLTPVPVASFGAGVKVLGVTMGDAATCAQTTAGPYCWGSNFVGQLGDGTTTDRHAPVAVAVPVAVTASPVVGTQHACALATGGDVYCWGDNSLGQLGNGKFTVALQPVDVRFP